MADPFRLKPRTLTEQDEHLINLVKLEAGDLYKLLNQLGDSREVSIAKTKLEEAVMWSVKHITA